MSLVLNGTTGVNKVQDDTVTSAKIVAGAVGASDLIVSAVTNTTFSTGAGTTTITNNGSNIMLLIAYGSGSASTTVLTATVAGAIQSQVSFAGGANAGSVFAIVRPTESCVLNASVGFSIARVTTMVLGA